MHVFCFNYRVQLWHTVVQLNYRSMHPSHGLWEKVAYLVRLDKLVYQQRQLCSQSHDGIILTLPSIMLEVLFTTLCCKPQTEVHY